MQNKHVTFINKDSDGSEFNSQWNRMFMCYKQHRYLHNILQFVQLNLKKLSNLRPTLVTFCITLDYQLSYIRKTKEFRS